MSKINAKMAIASAPQKMFLPLQQHFKVWMRALVTRRLVSSKDAESCSAKRAGVQLTGLHPATIM
jgi:hypothetical protein